MKHYEAPWSTTLIVISILTTVVCLGVSAGTWWEFTTNNHPALLRWVALMPFLILFGCALCTIRGYTITSDAILVHRLLSSTSLPRGGLESAHVEPDAMRWRLRTLGNGGAFAFSGFYYNKRLGSYRAYVSDPHPAVVLRYAKRRVVLSPATPEDFVQDLALAKP